MQKIIFFTDLDGTLLDEKTFSFQKAGPALKAIKETGSALVLCTSKTKPETLEYEEKLDIREPFIVENGGAIYIPNGYFNHEIPESMAEGQHLMISIGSSAQEIEKAVDQLAKETKIKPFHSMSIQEIAKETGLSQEQALRAKEKQFIASFELLEKKSLDKAKKFLLEKGYEIEQGGKYYSVSKGHSKGRAVKMLLQHYRQEFGQVTSIGLGNAENDIEMLRECDKAFLVANKGGKYASNEFEKAKGTGPEGWNNAVLKVVGQA